MEPMTIVWLVLAVVMIILESVTVQLVSIWFAIGAGAACIASLFTGSIVVQVIVFVAVSAAALAVTRPIAARLKEKKRVPTNSDRCIGREGVVTAAVDNDAAVGQVKVAGKLWSARSVDGSPIPEGAKVTVTAIEGVKLLCRRAPDE